MKFALILLPVLVLAACAGAAEPPSCRGAVFPLNPSHVAAPEAMP